MADFISLACPSCGGKLTFTADHHHYICDHCGVEHLIQYDQDMPWLEPVADIGRELAIKRLTEEIAALRMQRDAIYNPGSMAMGCAGVGGFFIVSNLAVVWMIDALPGAWWLIVAEIAVLVAIMYWLVGQTKEYRGQVEPIDAAIQRKQHELLKQMVTVGKKVE